MATHPFIAVAAVLRALPGAAQAVETFPLGAACVLVLGAMACQHDRPAPPKTKRRKQQTRRSRRRARS